MNFLNIALQLFPLCSLLVTWFFILVDNRSKEDARVRRLLHGRHVIIGDRLRILQEDGNALVDVDIRTYFDDLPNGRRF
jgi:hypothetical protein